ncbi:MAG: cytochrome c biogenesis protein CcdA [Gallionella sp.]|nr:cytochrome c biogenesis protein CcdA [Gallionella sp.]
MGGIAAVWGGFSSFFSIWQVCLLQISPFFIAFIVGIYLATVGKRADPEIRQWIIIPCITYGIGFIVFYSLLIASGLNISRPLIHNIGFLRVVSGIIILFAGLYILLVNRISFLRKIHTPLLLSTLSPLIGAAFALVYSPCITPMLSDIMGIASQRSTAVEGWYLAFCYGLGISIALCTTSVALILFTRKREIVLRNARIIINICGTILLVLGVMNITGLMRHYKAFVLGFVL